MTRREMGARGGRRSLGGGGMGRRVFLVVLDSFGIGEAPDAAEYGDEGSNTLLSLIHI